MDHVAIMKPSWKLTSKILSGEKKIESRWYKNRHDPWNKIKEEDTVYFKERKYIFVKAAVEKVLQFENLNQTKVKEILDQYGKEIGIEKNIGLFFNLFKDKKYCILVFLKDTQKIQPFKINKKGFGAMSAWICVENIEKIKI